MRLPDTGPLSRAARCNCASCTSGSSAARRSTRRLPPASLPPQNDLASLGQRVEEGEAPFDVDALNRAWPVVSQVGLAWLMKGYADRLGEISPPMQDMVRKGAAFPATAYYAALDVIIAAAPDAACFFSRST